MALAQQKIATEAKEKTGNSQNSKIFAKEKSLFKIFRVKSLIATTFQTKTANYSLTWK